MDKCPNCGFVPVQAQHLKSNVMNHYVNSLSGKPDGIYNNDAETFKLANGTELTRQDKWVPKNVSLKPATPVAPSSNVLQNVSKPTKPVPAQVVTVVSSAAPALANVTLPPTP